MRKALFITPQEPTLDEKFLMMDKAHDIAKERVDFLQRQADKIGEDFKKEKEKLWDEVKAFCRVRGVLPEDFSDTKYHFHFDSQARVLHLCDGEDHEGGGPHGGLPKGLSDLLGKLGAEGVLVGPFKLGG